MQEQHILVTYLRSTAATRKKIAGVIAFACKTPSWRLHFLPFGTDEALQKRIVESIRPDGALDPSPFTASLLDCPIVVTDAEPGFGRYDATFSCDNAAVAKSAAEHLTRAGVFKYFAYVGLGSQGDAFHSEVRHRAFVRELRKRGYQGDVPCIDSGTFDIMYERSSTRLMDWLKLLPKPCGIFVYHDFACQFVLAACQAARIKVPEQIGILGTDNEFEICKNTQPTISSIGIDFVGAGYNAAKLLDHFMRSGVPGKTIVRHYGVKNIHARMSTQNVVGPMKFVADVMERIRVCGGRDVSVATLAKEFDVSRRTLEYRFKAGQGRTIREEIMNARLATAAQLLVSSNAPLKFIAFKSGFGTESNLRYAFKKFRNTTLRKYRMENKLQ